MRVTIKEIAELAGVHSSTVDKVLHNRTGVSDEVREQVQRIIDELGYKPNKVGRMLQKQSTTLRIGVVLLLVDAKEYIKAGIESALKDLDTFNIEIKYYSVKISNVVEQAEIIKMLTTSGIDGIILHPINSPEVVEAVNAAVEAGIPVVTTNFDIKGCKRLCFVGQNKLMAGRIAGRLMGEFLQSHGNLAIIVGTPFSNGSADYSREKGFLDLIKSEYPELNVVESIITGDDPRVMLKESMHLLRSRRDLDGVYLTGGAVCEFGRAMYMTAGERNRNIKVICYERYEGIIQLLKDGIITCSLDSDLYEQGYRPLQILVDYLIYEKLPEEECIFTKTDILVKESVA